MGHGSGFAQQAWQHCYEAGNSFLQQGNLRNAAKAYSDALEACTDTEVRANIFYARAFVYLTANVFLTAIEDLSSAIKNNDRFADAYNLRGVCFARTNKSEAALADFSYAIELGLNDASPFLNRAKTFLELGLLEFSLPDLLDAIDRDSSHASWLQKLVKELTTEVQLSKCALTYANRALALHYSGMPGQAMQDLGAAINLASTPQEQSMVLARLAQIKIHEGDFIGAITECSRAVTNDPECTLAFYLAGLSYAGLGLLDEAQTTFAHCRSVAQKQGFAGADHYARACQTEISELTTSSTNSGVAFAVA